MLSLMPRYIMRIKMLCNCHFYNITTKNKFKDIFSFFANYEL
jgi:hypothetical protein